ncbi:TetR/AcrR family transcriptional regulator [Actinomadura rubrisoli]|uniref:TetR/AcrR family transcriptional regulator n=1 Tax=Actinomadura rubrisoli TaxID=2530368 RepID=A0A4V2YY48_9ACTN|nr:TetR/AcrR family transcriptional regulator [Actinomadura rubrisoli]TDD91837.1 TetR/AcrR family transcriptional regulator [Actinomadura rubrisoli]
MAVRDDSRDGRSGGSPRGAAVLRPELTESIVAAVVEQLASRGYRGLTMDAVARGAGIGKAAIYRRWPSKEAMVIDVISRFAVDALPMPDTGSLAGDMKAFLSDAWDALTRPEVAAIARNLIGEMAYTPELAVMLRTRVSEPRRRNATALLQRAIERGDLPPAVDIDLALDVMAGPLALRTLIIGTPVGPDYLDRLTAMTLAALGAHGRH